MKFLNISKKCSWGRQYLYINLKDLKSLKYDYEPGFISIHSDKEKIEGVGSIDPHEFTLFLLCEEKVFSISLVEDHEMLEYEEERLTNTKGE